LLVPLRNALGNAYKHGNARNPDGVVCVEIALTRHGALIAITDEGSGFDVALTFRRFQEQEDYCENRGAGFRNLHRARSTVSYENNGRTLLLCFRPAVRVLAPRGDALPEAADSEWIKTSLSAELPEFTKGQSRLEACRVYATRGPAGDDCGKRYLLKFAGVDGRPAATRVLTARLHATEAAAAADFEAATRLREANTSKRLLIPKPVARLAGEPRLVFYDFDAWMNLWEFLTFRGSLKSLRHRAERAGEALACLHRSQITLPRAETEFAEEELPAMIARTETNLQSLPRATELVRRFRTCVARLPEQPAFRRQQILAPIHGSFGWDCVHYGADGRFYLYRFETCRQSDPGLDLGGFAADLLCFTLVNYDAETYRAGHDAFLNNYNSNSEHPLDEDDLRFYIALALVERLQRAESHARLAQWLAALEVAICNRNVESEVAS
jgi:hypothetical protein